MFKFLQKLFKRKTEKVKSIPVKSVVIVSDELMLASLLYLLKYYFDGNYFKKHYKVIKEFITKPVPNLDDKETLLSNDELMNSPVDLYYKQFESLEFVKMAKRYVFLQCKCIEDPAFDDWMKRIVEYSKSGV